MRTALAFYELDRDMKVVGLLGVVSEVGVDAQIHSSAAHILK